MDAIAEVKKELDELKKIGTKVPAHAYPAAEKIAVSYYEDGMRISDIADFCILHGKLV